MERPKVETTAECGWHLNPQVALHENLSCYWDTSSHKESGGKPLLTQTTAVSRNITCNPVTLGGSHALGLCKKKLRETLGLQKTKKIIKTVINKRAQHKTSTFTFYNMVDRHKVCRLDWLIPPLINNVLCTMKRRFVDC